MDVLGVTWSVGDSMNTRIVLMATLMMIASVSAAGFATADDATLPGPKSVKVCASGGICPTVYSDTSGTGDICLGFCG